jgi:hypothetical protein
MPPRAPYSNVTREKDLSEREFKHSFPCGAEVKKDWNSTSFPIVCLHGVCWENFTSLTRTCTRWYYIQSLFGKITLTCEIIYTLSYIESPIDFHFGLRDLKWSGTNQPVGNAETFRYFLSSFEERNKRKYLGERRKDERSNRTQNVLKISDNNVISRL